jgi:hypothetical protein
MFTTVKAENHGLWRRLSKDVIVEALTFERGAEIAMEKSRIKANVEMAKPMS